MRKYSEIDYVRERRELFRDQPYEYENALKTVRLDIFDKRFSKYNEDKSISTMSEDERYGEYIMKFHEYLLRWLQDFQELAQGGDEAERIKSKYERMTIYVQRRLYWADMLLIEQKIIKIMHSLPDNHVKKYRMDKIYADLFLHEYRGLMPEESILAKKQDVIGEAARIRYVDASRAGKGFIWAAVLAYGVGGGILFWILVKQCQAVLSASGWISA